MPSWAGVSIREGTVLEQRCLKAGSTRPPQPVVSIRRTCVALAASAIAAAVVGASGAGALPSPVLQAQVVSIQRPSALVKYTTADYGKKVTASDDRVGTTTWRAVQGTGNCCENYLTATSGGRLLDFGGSFINFTDDGGLTWSQVRPLTPLVNGEGTIVVAPNGDVDAIGWDPYSGDHLQAYKYEAFSGKWFYAEQPLHQPFYDREWITVLPGPFSINGQTVPYITFVKGGYPWKDPAFYSTDGLTYTDASSMFVDEMLNGSVEGYLDTAADSTFDWIQPNTGGGMTPLGAGSALARGEFTTDWGRLDRSTLSWHTFAFPGGVQPQGLYQVDSAGRIHNVVPNGTGFDYRISADGGRSWRSAAVALPPNYSIDQIDFRASKALGVAAVAVHALSSISGNDQDFAYKFNVATNQPFLQRRYTIGLGDTGSAAGVGNSVRMDFQTIAILPDGRLAVSFLDSTTHYPSPTTGAEQTRPAVAIEQTTTFH
jgi:hypothetical protein